MNIADPIARQYHAALKMLGKAIEVCPEPMWLSAPGASPNRFWHLAYHTLFYTHFYLSPSENEFLPWSLHRAEYNFLGAIPWRPNEPHIVDRPYTQPELLDYLAHCHSEVDRQLSALDPEAASGFHWIPFNKLGLQLYNLRHLAHHTGQLTERLRSEANIPIPWTG